MGEDEAEIKIIQEAGQELSDFGLSWDDLRSKTVLDAGSRASNLSFAAKHVSNSAKIVSIDLHIDERVLAYPTYVRQTIAQGDAESMPFADNTFDLILNHGSIMPNEMLDELRVLRPGGEIRMFPIGSQVLEQWEISYYLDAIKGLPQEVILETLIRLDHEIEEADGWLPQEYTDLRDEALDSLSSDQKKDVIEQMVQRWTDVSGIPFEYHINNPEAREPNGYMFYKKPM